MGSPLKLGMQSSASDSFVMILSVTTRLTGGTCTRMNAQNPKADSDSVVEFLVMLPENPSGTSNPITFIS